MPSQGQIRRLEMSFVEVVRCVVVGVAPERPIRRLLGGAMGASRRFRSNLVSTHAAILSRCTHSQSHSRCIHSQSHFVTMSRRTQSLCHSVHIHIGHIVTELHSHSVTLSRRTYSHSHCHGVHSHSHCHTVTLSWCTPLQSHCHNATMHTLTVAQLLCAQSKS